MSIHKIFLITFISLMIIKWFKAFYIHINLEKYIIFFGLKKVIFARDSDYPQFPTSNEKLHSSFFSKCTKKWQFWIVYHNVTKLQALKMVATYTSTKFHQNRRKFVPMMAYPKLTKWIKFQFCPLEINGLDNENIQFQEK